MFDEKNLSTAMDLVEDTRLEDLFPLVIANQLRGNVVRRTETSISSQALSNGQAFTNQVTIGRGASQNAASGQDLFAIVERTLFVDNITADDILWGGSNITESQWQIMGDMVSVYKTNGDLVANNELVNRMYISNISAGSVTVYVYVKVRYLTLG